MALTREDCDQTYIKKTEITTNRLKQASNAAIKRFEELTSNDGSYGEHATDIACYYKSPMMFIAAEKLEKAKIILNFIQKHYMTSVGDFKSSDSVKSIKPEYSEYYTYINGWIVRAANLLNANDTKLSGYSFLKNYYLAENFLLTNKLKNQSDVLTVAHQGLINLEMGNRDMAILAGETLIKILNQQTNIHEGFYLRFDQKSKLVTDFDTNAAAFYYVSIKKTNQLYFMIGYPCAFLAILSKATGEERFLNAAKKYFDFAISCGSNLLESNFSHKIAWAASILLERTGEKKYLTTIEKISDYFLSKQNKNGLWLEEEGVSTSLDQSAEIACWFICIQKNLEEFKRKYLIEPTIESNLAESTLSSGFKI